MKAKNIHIFCPDTSTDGRTKRLTRTHTNDNVCKDVHGNQWEALGTQGILTWWKMTHTSSGVILHDEPFIGYEVLHELSSG